MKVGLISYHFRNTTAEGIATGRVAAALVAAGHHVSVFSSLPKPQPGAPTRTVESSGRLVLERVYGDETSAPAWWRAIVAQGMTNRACGKLAAVPNLAYGCSVTEWGWVQQVSQRVIEAWRAEGGFDVLHSRLNPHMSHLAALRVTRAIPACAWCPYFSDPWPYSLYPDPYRFTVGPVARVRLESILDRMVDRADTLIFPAERLKTYLLTGRRRSARGKAFVAPHLSRPDVTVGPLPAHPHLVIRHAGFLMKQRRIEPLYGALRRLLHDRPEISRTLRIEFAGRYEGRATPEPPAELREIVKCLPFMSTDVVWNWLEEADVLLLVEAKMSEGIFFPSKLAEYLGAGRPILALSPRTGVTTDLLSGSGAWMVEPDDEEAISRALSDIWNEWRSGRLAERTPGEVYRRLVSAEGVVPIYEEAFAAAMDRRGS